MTMAARRFLRLSWLPFLFAGACFPVPAAESNATGTDFFERKVRPLFSESSVTSPRQREPQITDQDRAHWAFQPLHRPTVPPGANPIDAFVLAQLRAKGLAPNPPATPRELVRRAYFDLTGLPPTPEEVTAFEKDPGPDRYERLLDHLLARPQYGECWGRHWLDVARFAQSNGYERDAEKPLAWRYRDYVIKAFNDDKPYDRFVLEQIAGDELPDATAESVAATAFQRLGVWDDEPDDKRMAEFDALDDVLSTTGAAFLGLTLGCARCHDHKFDPIPQADYYALLAFFRGVRPYENGPPSWEAPGFAPLAPPQEANRWRAGQKAKLEPLEQQRAAAPDEKEKKRLEQAIQKVNEETPFEWTLAVRERGTTPPTTHVLQRGDAAKPGAEAEPAFLRVLGGEKPQSPTVAEAGLSSGRRLALARWIARPENPLTARVLVNRVWQHHFGRGLVKSTTDLGRAGAPPTHPQLLDWLAADFIESGWSIKALHKRIMLSQTYGQSSRADQPRALAVDPENRLLWHQNLRRLEAEAVRDAVLCVAGTLNPRMGGRGFFPHLSGEVLAGQSRPGLDWEVSSDAEQARRSVYAFVRRTMAIPLLESFDYSNTTSPLAERATTTVAPQALMLLNDDFLQQQAAAFAGRLEREAGADVSRQIQRAYQLAFNRPPTRRETEAATALLRRQTAAFSGLSSRLTFRPEVASALSVDYFDRLPPSLFLLGPRAGWHYYRGSWAGAYEGIRVLDRARAPFALWPDARFQDGIVETKVGRSGSTEFAGLLFRAEANGDVARGYEVVFDLRRQRVALRRHGAELVTLAEAEADLPPGQSFAVKIEARGARFRVWLYDRPQPLLDIRDDHPIEGAGAIGVRTWGGALSLDDLAVTTAEGRREAGRGDPAQARALQSFCLLLVNLNEFLYVD
jgi:hypothetical protein